MTEKCFGFEREGREGIKLERRAESSLLFHRSNIIRNSVLAESLVDLGEVIQGALLAFGKYSIAGVDPSSAHNFSGVIHSIKVGPQGLGGGRRSEKRREN